MSATQRKDRLYAQLSSGLVRLKQSSTRTTDLVEGLQNDLEAMKTFSGIHAAQCVVQLLSSLLKTDALFVFFCDRFMTVANGINEEPDEKETSSKS